MNWYHAYKLYMSCHVPILCKYKSHLLTYFASCDIKIFLFLPPIVSINIFRHIFQIQSPMSVPLILQFNHLVHGRFVPANDAKLRCEYMQRTAVVNVWIGIATVFLVCPTMHRQFNKHSQNCTYSGKEEQRRNDQKQSVARLIATENYFLNTKWSF